MESDPTARCSSCGKPFFLGDSLFGDVTGCICDNCGGPLVSLRLPPAPAAADLPPIAGEIPDDLFPPIRKYRTIEEAQAFLKSAIKDGAGCPCCGQLVKDYKFRILATMAATLIWVVGRARRKNETWVHLNNAEAPDWIKADRNYPRLAYWELLVPKLQPEKGEKRCSGFWKPTEKGVEFVFNRLKVPEFVLAYNNVPFERSESQISVKDALQEKFQYDELMNTWVL